MIPAPRTREEIEARLKAITPGEWFAKRSTIAVDGAYDYAICSPDTQVIAEAFGRTSTTNYPPAEANAQFIANAPADLSYLLDQNAAFEDMARAVKELQAANVEVGKLKVRRNDAVANAGQFLIDGITDELRKAWERYRAAEFALLALQMETPDGR